MTLPLFTVADMVAAERAADAAGHSYAAMMEIAGRRVAEAIAARWPVAGKTVTVLVGPGNNGGDGLVAAHYLAAVGADVGVYQFPARDPDADPNLRRVHEDGLFVLDAAFDMQQRVLRHRMGITDIVVDGLLGTGVNRPVKGPLAQILRITQAVLTARRSGAPPPAMQTLGETKRSAASTFPVVVAVDCPSGLNCDTGAIDPLALDADLTVTFAAPKHGHLRFPGAAHCGELVVADINIDPTLAEVADAADRVATAASVADMLPRRPLDGHKGTFGRVLIAAGSLQYRGAPLLAARAAFRAGAGLVALATPAPLHAAASTALPEVTYLLNEDTVELSAATAQQLQAGLAQYKALLLGPGLGDAAEFVTTLLASGALPPLVVDADGLNLLAQQSDWWKLLPPNSVLTPHPGEMARLLGISLSELKTRDRWATARTAAQAWGQVVLLKGAYTVVAEPAGQTITLPFANPLLAVGGSGDVLAGVIAALLAQGSNPFAAAVAGGWLHAATGEQLRQQVGSGGVLASEIADGLPQARIALV